MRIRMPEPQWGVDLHHLGVLWQLDADKDGLVSMMDLDAFLCDCDAVSSGHPAHEFPARMQAWCMLQLTGERRRWLRGQ